jgi:hypothetical protein
MKLTSNLTKPFWIHLKGFLFATLGLLAGVLLVAQTFTVKTALLYAAGAWGFCRFYYYLFHVLERYLGGNRYSGIIDQIRHLLRMPFSETEIQPEDSVSPHAQTNSGCQDNGPSHPKSDIKPGL